MGDLCISRQFRGYGVGLERTGTTFLADLFQDNYRSAHEPDWRKFIELYTNDEAVPDRCSSLKAWLRARDRVLRLEFESSHLLGPVVPILAELFPDSKFIATIRHPRTWLRSVTDWALNKDILDPDSPWRSLFDMYYGPATDYDSEVLKRHDLYPLDGYLRYWQSHYQRVIHGVPSHRLLVVRTGRLSQSLERIAGFLEVERDQLSLTERSNKNPECHNVLNEMDTALLEKKIQRHCGPLLAEYFPA